MEAIEKINKLGSELLKELFNLKVKSLEKEDSYLEWINIEFEKNKTISLGKNGDIICSIFLTDFLNKEELREFVKQQYEIMLPLASTLRIQNLKNKKEELKEELKQIERELKNVGKE